MHWDKTSARIILILSVVHVVVAAPAIVRQRSLDVDEDVTPASEKRGNPGDTPQDLYPVPQMDNKLPTTSGIPPSQDPSPEPGTPKLYNDPTPTSGAPPSQDDTSSAPGDPPYHNDPPTGSKDPQLQGDPPSASGVHNDATSETSSENDDLSSERGDFDPSHVWGWLNDAPPEPWSHVDSESPKWPDPGSEYASQLLGSEAPTPPPEVGKPFVEKHFKLLAGLGSIVSGLIAFGAHKLIYGRSYGALPGRDLTSSDVVGRGASTHPRPLQKPVSRPLANFKLRKEDLGLLSVLTRRALERLD